MISIASLAAALHVVTKSFAPKLAAPAEAASAMPCSAPSATSSGMSQTASISLPLVSRTAPAGTVRFSDTIPDILARSSGPKVAATV